jgi:hypothetical protein
MEITDPSVLREVPDNPAVLLLEADVKAAVALVATVRDLGMTVKRLRGRKMRTVAGFYDEVAAVLQFPYYFGENWDAFDECLQDLDLSAGGGLVLVIVDAVDVLADEQLTELEILVRTFVDAQQEYRRPVTDGERWDRPAVPFHVVLQVLPADSPDTSARWTAAGAELRPVVFMN